MTCLAGKRILVVEDEFFIAEDMIDSLADAGAAIAGPFTSCAEAMARMADSDIHAAVLDIRLGHEDCYPLARRLSLHAVPYLFYTGLSPNSIPREFAAILVLQKPAKDGALVAALVHLLSSP